MSIENEFVFLDDNDIDLFKKINNQRIILTQIVRKLHDKCEKLIDDNNRLIKENFELNTKIKSIELINKMFRDIIIEQSDDLMDVDELND